MLKVACDLVLNLWFEREDFTSDFHTSHSGEMLPHLPFTTFAVQRNPQNYNLQEKSFKSHPI